MCIIGAGFTGLWTAYWLKEGEPSLDVVVLEAETVGFGASGRNGGWLSGFMPGNRDVMAAAPSGKEGVIAFQRALIRSVSEVTAICAAEGIDADLVQGGTLAVATTAAQMRRIEEEVAADRAWGLNEDDVRLVSRAELDMRLLVAGAAGGAFNPHCARIQPAKLVRGLADLVEGRGVRIYEHSPATSVSAGGVKTDAGEVRAAWVVQATEGFTPLFQGQRRRLLPMNSSVVVTERLRDEVWSEIGWDGCETLRDGAHAYVYLQRTADGRIAIGGRGNPYRFGSRFDPSGSTPPATVGALRSAAVRMFPRLAGVRFEDSWSGVLGVARDWCPFIEVSPAGAGGDGGGGGGPVRAGAGGVVRAGAGGVVRAGGYVGDGVTTSYLAGRTVGDLVLGRSTELTALPWVGHRSRRWEPEPLRWLGVHALYRVYRRADRVEAGRPDDPRTSRWALLADRIAGRG